MENENHGQNHLMRRFIWIFVLLVFFVGCGGSSDDGEARIVPSATVPYNPTYTPSDTPNAATIEVRRGTNTARTAIAITRNPALLNPPTLNSLEMTATVLLGTSASYWTDQPTLQAATETALAINQTEISVWQTAHPDVTPTRTPRMAATCSPHFFSSNLQDSAAVLVAALDTREYLLAAPIAIDGTIGEYIVTNCGDEHLVRTSIYIWVGLWEEYPSDREMIANITQEVVLGIAAMSPQPRRGSQPTKLHIYFRSGEIRQEINTEFENALAAAEEGLTGDDFLLALGEFVP